LHAFRGAIIELARPGVVVVPNTRAAGEVIRLLDRNPSARRQAAPPDVVTRDGLYDRLHACSVHPPRRLSQQERDAMAQAAAREAVGALDLTSSFQLRPGLVAEMLRFYDQLRRQRQQVARFEELLTESLDRDASFDRGAERMLRQTRLLSETFRRYECRVAASGACDEHAFREWLLANASPTPIRAVTVTVADWIADPDGLYVADFDLLTRIPGLETIDVLATDAILGSGFHQRLHDWFPGLEEAEYGSATATSRPVLVVPAGTPDRVCFLSRDREEELVGIARRLKADRQEVGPTGLPQALDRVAVVYKRPLPYLYLARDVFRGARLPYRTSDTFPLAAEPAAAALDLVLEFGASSYTRISLVGLLRSPHFIFEDENRPISCEAVSALDRALSDARYLGDLNHLSALAAAWRGGGRHNDALPALRAALKIAEEIEPIRVSAPASLQVERLLSIITAYMPPPSGDSWLAVRQRRARSAIVETLEALAAASRAHDDAPLDIESISAMARRWIEEQTFAVEVAPDDHGLNLIDDQAARYGDFDEITLVGLLDGEWPERARRNIFYPPALLAALGWPSERDWRSAAEARFIDLLQSAGRRVYLSTVTLDDEALVQPSSFLDEVARARLVTHARELPPERRMFVEEALSLDPAVTEVLEPNARQWAELRLARSNHADPKFHGQTARQPARAWSVSAVETYVACPFKFFAQHVLRLEEEPDDEEVMDPRR
jgi:PD-(D/E)XK nuclease superfamily